MSFGSIDELSGRGFSPFASPSAKTLLSSSSCARGGNKLLPPFAPVSWMSIQAARADQPKKKGSEET